MSDSGASSLQDVAVHCDSQFLLTHGLAAEIAFLGGWKAQFGLRSGSQHAGG